MADYARTMKDLGSDKAVLARREINGEQGGALVFCVVLSDGFILDLGSSSLAEARANVIADMINAAGPEKLAQKSLAKWREDGR